MRAKSCVGIGAADCVPTPSHRFSPHHVVEALSQALLPSKFLVLQTGREIHVLRHSDAMCELRTKLRAWNRAIKINSETGCAVINW